jgi:hypothetical protein
MGIEIGPHRLLSRKLSRAGYIRGADQSEAEIGLWWLSQ